MSSRTEEFIFFHLFSRIQLLHTSRHGMASCLGCWTPRLVLQLIILMDSILKRYGASRKGWQRGLSHCLRIRDPQMAILGKWWLTNNQWISTDLWVNNFQTNPVVFETCLYTFTGTSHGCCCIQESQWRRRDVLEPNAFALPFEGLQRGLRNSLELHIKHPTHLTSDVFLSFPSVHHGSSIPELVEGSISRKSQPV